MHECHKRDYRTRAFSYCSYHIIPYWNSSHTEIVQNILEQSVVGKRWETNIYSGWPLIYWTPHTGVPESINIKRSINTCICSEVCIIYIEIINLSSEASSEYMLANGHHRRSSSALKRLFFNWFLLYLIPINSSEDKFRPCSSKKESNITHFWKRIRKYYWENLYIVYVNKLVQHGGEDSFP